MKLTREQVIHISTLARIKLTEDEITRFSDELSDILTNFDELLAKIDANVDPLILNELSGVMREDEARPSLTQDEILSNAPDQEEGCFKVKAVLE
ncbi:MAG: Asp-tRNA(Asn)/Glu-tRNA(Gln) amidotransferase subunit GatC [Chloroflexi bacterium]|jgi:aspartyl-tRNA(Asn)/glutamyl-tRNA(Gln) amidotransferase subunit C|nr:Asp-tRNA(Asn)/Glu-tRNA(Gln) amidotransferase subunit GatC [Chloroflexota bacterium]MBT7080119.1 Asp-tRNA(Asn)/Glu-tRNA(Gln) amidotransferase subunit GatC [Chloroflexota bacterium]MBT7290197.1 Asp-tRNA(Asn)/Glu-tRNA(Gln) amidotransferase subunit GatC [Chloroflexota bacterium]